MDNNLTSADLSAVRRIRMEEIKRSLEEYLMLQRERRQRIAPFAPNVEPFDISEESQCGLSLERGR